MVQGAVPYDIKEKQFIYRLLFISIFHGVITSRTMSIANLIINRLKGYNLTIQRLFRPARMLGTLILQHGLGNWCVVTLI